MCLDGMTRVFVDCACCICFVYCVSCVIRVSNMKVQ